MTMQSDELRAAPGDQRGSAPGAEASRASVSWAWDTPLATGAISICRLLAHDGDAASLDAILESLTGCAAPAPGAIAHRNLASIDDGVIVRLSDVSALVMPHGGIAIRRAIDTWLQGAGASPRSEALGCQAGALARDALRTYPEASSPVEALALCAISRAASPRAIPLLLAQDARMHTAAARGWRPGPSDEARAHRLSRLLRPPLVVAVGAANAGKSSLLNALAGRTVAIAADMPGTTRDCVAGRVVLDGLAVDWLDTPGIRDTDDSIEIQSRAIARTLAQRADLVIGVDASDAPLPVDCSAIVARAPDIVIRTKSDRPDASRAATVPVSALSRTGLDALAIAVRRALVPDADLQCADPWIFEPSLR
ncbi:MAG: GTP-binding protein [Phycisphaerales bacterium]|nr:GTP-binding protein [Phycisphaerales bacterium]